MSQAFAYAFYHSAAWNSCRELYMKSVGGLCEDCLAKGIYTPAKVVHHIQHLTPENIKDRKITLGWDNLRAVCQDCHAKEHKQKINRRYHFDALGNVIIEGSPPGDKSSAHA